MYSDTGVPACSHVSLMWTWDTVLETLLVALTKIDGKSNLRKEGFVWAHPLRAWLITVGKAVWGAGAWGSCTCGLCSAVRKQREMTAIHSAFTSISSVWTEPIRMIPPTFIVDLPTPVNLIEIIPPSRAQSFVSMVIPSLVKSTIKI